MKIVGCITNQHDLRLVLAAALICAIACFTTFNMLFRGQAARGSLRIAWQSGAGAVLGSGVFATHFISELAYDPGMPVAYEVHTTLLSLAIACCGSMVATAVYMLPRGRAVRVIGAGLLLGATIAAMHFTGMRAMRLPASIAFDPRYVAASVVVGASLSLLGFAIGAQLGSLGNRIAGASCLLLAICGMHFLGMSAVTLVPRMMPRAANEAVWSSGSLGVTVAIVSSAILLFSLLGTALDQYLESKVRHLAYHDALTGLPNRLLFNERLSQGIEFAKRTKTGVAVMCLDLDKFKAVNDLLGHECGDALLTELGRRLQRDLRSIDTVARLGGDEFAIVQPLVKDERSSAALAERIVRGFAVPFEVNGHQVGAGVSIGIACYPKDGETGAALLKHADAALYRAKGTDNRVCFFERGMELRIQERRELENDLRLAVQRGEMQLHYQPQFACDRGELIGFEALLRWSHPVRGFIPPERFLPIAEESGAINAIGAWVLQTACAEAVRWREPLRVAVNLSPMQFRPCIDLGATIAEVLQATGLAPARLEVEITERVLNADCGRALRALRALHDIGVQISLDDFGTGCSSLSYLWRFPFDRIKIDHAFVHALGNDARATSIVSAMLGLAHELKLGVTAEGVETAEQLQMLREIGCDQAQGYLLGRPAPPDRLIGVAQHRPALAKIGAVAATRPDRPARVA
ncbi:MAG: EAL domain-containing protein [Alphaproteobacteria bacterium]|nr:EAL domain-containing protein [Alphaproteobacteria bacterium]